MFRGDLRARVAAREARVRGERFALLARAVVPTRKDRRWEIELAPLTRMQAWKVDPLEPGAEVGVLGFTFHEEKGDPVLRAGGGERPRSLPCPAQRAPRSAVTACLRS